MSSLEMSLTTAHMSVFESDKQFRVVNAGRRFGKTQLALLEIAKAVTSKYVDGVGRVLPPIICYACPTLSQAEDILWERMLTFFGSNIVRTNKKSFTAWFKNGACVKFGGSLNWNSLRGKYCCLCIVDEFAFCDNPDDFYACVLPMLATPKPNGRILFLSTPDGKNHFYDAFMKEKSDGKWASFHYVSTAGGFITETEIENFRSSFTHAKFKQEFYGEFVNPTGLVYYSFDRSKHVMPRNKMTVRHKEDIHWAWDFNVNPACHSTISVKRTDKVMNASVWLVLDEIAVGNTPDNVHEFIKRYAPEDIGTVYLYGDYNGNINTAGLTDYKVIESTLKHHGYKVEIRVYGRNPVVRDRTENVNRLLMNTLNQCRLYVSQECDKLIRDFELVKRSSTSAIDKTSNADLTHISDALGYQLWVTEPPREIIVKGAKHVA